MTRDERRTIASISHDLDDIRGWMISTAAEFVAAGIPCDFSHPETCAARALELCNKLRRPSDVL